MQWLKTFVLWWLAIRSLVVTGDHGQFPFSEPYRNGSVSYREVQRRPGHNTDSMITPRDVWARKRACLRVQVSLSGLTGYQRTERSKKEGPSAPSSPATLLSEMQVTRGNEEGVAPGAESGVQPVWT